MFNQFLDQVSAYNFYLISSLGMFMLFFIVVTILLITMKKEEITYMSDLPLSDDGNAHNEDIRKF